MFDYSYTFISYFGFKILVLTFLIGLSLISLLISLTVLLSPSNKNQEKIAVYECGFHPFQTARVPVDVHFYIIGILFLIFDMEIIFIYPWFGVSYLVGWSGLFSLSFFLIILIIGFLYEYFTHMLTWNIK
jgi:NADH-quinone oxidoreductase subunit A